jgi:hypothetical protein
VYPSFVHRLHPSQSDPEIVLPMSVHESFSMETLKTFFNELIDPAGALQPPSLTLAIIESDSTNVYYRLFNGIRPPDEKLILTKTPGSNGDN